MMQGCSSCTSCTIFINFFLSAPYSASWANHLKLYRTALTRVRQSVNMSFLANSPLEAICYSLAFGSSRKCGGAIKIQKYGIILKNHTRFNIINSAVGYSWCLMGSYQDTTFFLCFTCSRDARTLSEQLNKPLCTCQPTDFKVTYLTLGCAFYIQLSFAGDLCPPRCHLLRTISKLLQHLLVILLSVPFYPRFATSSVTYHKA